MTKEEVYALATVENPIINDSGNKMGYYAFGESVPPVFIKELIEDGVPKEEITTDYLETLLEYERRDKE